MRGYTVDHRTGNKSLAHRGIDAPVGAILEEIPDGDGEIMVGVHQPNAARDNAVTVGVGVVAKGDVKAIFEFNQSCHCIG